MNEHTGIFCRKNTERTRLAEACSTVIATRNPFFDTVLLTWWRTRETLNSLVRFVSRSHRNMFQWQFSLPPSVLPAVVHFDIWQRQVLTYSPTRISFTEKKIHTFEIVGFILLLKSRRIPCLWLYYRVLTSIELQKVVYKNDFYFGNFFMLCFLLLQLLHTYTLIYLLNVWWKSSIALMSLLKIENVAGGLFPTRVRNVYAWYKKMLLLFVTRIKHEHY